MARVGRLQFPGPQVQDAEPDGHEHLLLVILADPVVRRLQDFPRAHTGHRDILDHDLGGHHEQRRGNALAAHVRHDQRQMVVIDQEEVVEVAAYFLRRLHRRVNVKFRAVRECREHARQHICLDAGRQRQFRADALLLRRRRRQFINIFGDLLLHMVDGSGQFSDLILVFDGFRQFCFGGHFLCRKSYRFVRDLCQRLQQHPAQIEMLRDDDDDHQQRQHQEHKPDKAVAHPRQVLHLPLHAQDGLRLPVRSLHRHHGRDMRIRLDVAAVADHNLRVGFPVIQPAVFFLIFVVGRVTDVSEVILRIFALFVDRGKEERDMRVIGQIRPDHIDERRAGGVAQAVQFRPDVHVFFRCPFALRVGIRPVAVYFRPGGIRDLNRPVFIQFQHTVCKTAVSQNPDDHRQQDHWDDNPYNAFENNAFAGLLHLGSPFGCFLSVYHTPAAANPQHLQSAEKSGEKSGKSRTICCGSAAFHIIWYNQHGKPIWK